MRGYVQTVRSAGYYSLPPSRGGAILMNGAHGHWIRLILLIRRFTTLRRCWTTRIISTGIYEFPDNSLLLFPRFLNGAKKYEYRGVRCRRCYFQSEKNEISLYFSLMQGINGDDFSADCIRHQINNLHSLLSGRHFLREFCGG